MTKKRQSQPVSVLDDDIDFKKGMTAGFVGDDLFIESMRENCNIHISIVDNPFEITRFALERN